MTVSPTATGAGPGATAPSGRMVAAAHCEGRGNMGEEILGSVLALVGRGDDDDLEEEEEEEGIGIHGGGGDRKNRTRVHTFENTPGQARD